MKQIQILTLKRVAFVLMVVGICGNVLAGTPKPARNPGILFLEESGFPTLETEPLSFSEIQQVLKGRQITKTDFAGLHRWIDEKANIDLLIWPYGSAMSDKVWTDIFSFLQKGGNLIVTGGRPFSINVTKTKGGYKTGSVTNRFTEQLNIYEAYPVPVDGMKCVGRHPDFGFLPNAFALQPSQAFSLLAFTGTNRLSEGLWGNLSSRFTSILCGMDSSGVKTVPLISCMDRYHSDFVGGRWVFFTFTPQEGYWRTAEGKSLLKAYIPYAAQKPVETDIVPDYAFYQPGEMGGLEIRLHVLGFPGASFNIDVLISNQGHPVEKYTDIRVPATDTLVHLNLKKPLKEGLYQISLTIRLKDKILEQRMGGFICGDREKLKVGLPFSTNSHFLVRGEKVYPVVGMTYMSTEKNRHFLQYPNPVVWDRDMKEMKSMGINMLRTGLWKWYPYELFMDSQGKPNEKTLRSLDAWLYTAKKYDLPVQVCLFPFQPQVPGSVAPFTDTIAGKIQFRYLRLLAERYKDNPDLIWDLMNEPTYGKDGRLWSGNVPTGQNSEKSLWNQWLQNKYWEGKERLPERFNTISADLLKDTAVNLPEEKDLARSNLYGEGEKPLMAYDYNFFAQFAYNRWASKARKTFRDAGSRQLVVTGMDEGGVTNRILASFYAETSDFTNQHSWWQDDDLLWDNLLAKTPQKPLLVQETNLMRFTDPRESPRRNEQDYRNTLERKICIGLGAEGAGVIPWVWNANTLLNQNESSIGIYRGDGTASPEREMYGRFVKFVKENASYFTDSEPQDILLVAPHSLQFSVLQPLAVTATKNAVRAMHYYTRLSFDVAGEYQLNQVKGRPRLLLLPSAQILSDEAWQTLCRWVSEGSVLLVTGPVDQDPHFESVCRLSGMVPDINIAPVLDLHSSLTLGKEQYSLDYYNTSSMQTMNKMVWKQETGKVRTIAVGKGKILMTEYPVELNTNLGSVAALYSYAAEQAGIKPSFTTDCTNHGILVRPMDYEKTRLYLLESETNTDEIFTISDRQVDRTYTVKLESGRAKLLLISKQDGRVLAEY
jgi:Cellulase (glycosyl hydrolase family 5).